ncbi:MAG: PolC-type DNA polymerase III [Oscillospiraceae bacterium]|jgi:DNA polymerase-3 subunit alpha (Gram-positive type)|nr:PolC-type DNA polymerase III [Oscillospiraceae bacterium]
MNKAPFFEVFPELGGAGLPRPFGSAFVTSVRVDKSGAAIEIDVEFLRTPSFEELADAENALRESLGFRRAAISPSGSSPPAAPSAPKPPATAPPATAPKRNAPPSRRASASPRSLLGRVPTGAITAMGDIDVNLGNVTVEGRVFAVNSREVKNGSSWVLSFDMTDNTGSLRVSKFMRGEDARRIAGNIKAGMYLAVSGRLILDKYENNDTVLEPVNIALSEAREKRRDDAPVKRVELHLHTKMSAMDAITDTSEAIARAIEWGHPALAITDHGGAQSFPDAAHAPEDIKIIYGVEGYFVNDMDSRPGVFGELEDLDREFVVFDIETTGLSSYTDKITEIAAVTVSGGEIVSEFHTYADPGMHIPREITELTGITDETVRGAPSQIDAVRAFLDYAGGHPLAAHNASFDLGFIYEVCFANGVPFENACLDTLALARVIFPELYNHKLPTVSSALRLPKFDHHHALADAKTTGLITAAFIKILKERGLYTSEAVNRYVHAAPAKQRRRVNHIILLAKTPVGLKNLYRLITDSHLEHFNRNPVIPKSLLVKHRDGLLIGSACEAGEIFSAVERGSRFERHRLAKFYDYLEIQPVSNNFFMLRGAKPRARDAEQLRGFNRSIVELGREAGKPVCATGDVHFLDPEDEIFRKVLLNAKNYESALDDLPLYFRTTEEMLEEFSYLGERDCYDAVVTNTRAVADMIERISPLPPPKKLFSPKIENSAEDLKLFVGSRLRELYGETPPELVTARVDAEMRDILGRGYDVIYITARRLVKDSNEHGYLVGSRGSIGSSFAAYLAGITEVNALPAHYRCPKCLHADFESGAGFGCGADMPDAVCPVCGERYEKDGFDIPFETFLGFGGDKVPDIDLNFSGEYQAEAHRFTTELFGAEHVFRAGTIGTVKLKTAFGYVKKYLETIGKTVTRAEENRLAQGCVGVKRTTGQHPGGLIVIPQGMDITDFCPVQRPADDADSDIITTHFEYHCMEDNLLKLDELGHDDPTMIKMLEDLTGVSATDIPLDDPDTLKIFSSPLPLGAPEGDPVIGKTGTIGISEFGTGFVRQMLRDTLPDKVATLVRLSGYSHGTDVWLGNAKDIIMNKIADISETIGCRDDITLYLISRGMDARRAYKISESVRKGKGLAPEEESEMTELGVPDWYINSCKKIKYLFPKAHAAAYVMMALRIAWFKVHHPLAFYSAYFYRRSQKGSFDAGTMTRGDSAVLGKIREIKALPDRDKKDKDEDLLTTLEACHEFYSRGYSFLDVDIYESDAVKFEIVGNTSLCPPLIAVAGLGETVARDIAERRRGREFISIEDFSAECPKVSSAHIESLRSLGAFGALSETSQMTLFSLI